MNNNNKKNGYLLIISAVILWSLSGLLVKSVTATSFWEIILLLFSGIVFQEYLMHYMEAV